MKKKKRKKEKKDKYTIISTKKIINKNYFIIFI